ncbi:MAG: hypothetical protein A2294_01485 [Candidatus Magasanikbacteria bacterium RIFOXYB2_FULL_38_10]|nr:MAG: hypothetical protein A2294_01485 [Candidatus Magasanikbacteria bacterium RIFOXYB2_FULL_38_10]
MSSRLHEGAKPEETETGLLKQETPESAIKTTELLDLLSSLRLAREELEKLYSFSGSPILKPKYESQPVPPRVEKYAPDVKHLSRVLEEEETAGGLPLTADLAADIKEKAEAWAKDMEISYKKIGQAEKKIFSSSDLKKEWQKTLGTDSKVASWKEVDQKLADVLHPFYDLWQKIRSELLAAIEESAKKPKIDKPKTAGKILEREDVASEAAWEAIGMANPAEKISLRKQQMAKEALKIIFSLPGNHQSLRSEFFDSTGNLHLGNPKTWLKLFNEIYLGAQEHLKQSGRPATSLVDIVYSKEEIDQLISEVFKVLDKSEKIIGKMSIEIKPPVVAEEEKPQGIQSEGGAEQENQPPREIIPVNLELSGDYEQLATECRELFGEYFIGIEEVDRAFTLENGRHLMNFTPERQRQAETLLQQKLTELAEFFNQLGREGLRSEWFLVLEVDSFADGTPLNLKNLREKVEPDMQERNQGKLTASKWWENESWANTPFPMSWKLVHRGSLPNSSAKDYIAQTKFLRGFLQEHNLLSAEDSAECSDARLEQIQTLINNGDWRGAAEQLSNLAVNSRNRPEPLEIIYQFFTVFRTSGNRLYNNSYHWSAKRSAGGKLVSVGNCGAGGADLSSWEPGLAHSHLGVSLSV